MAITSRNLYTKEQTKRLFDAWGFSETPLPAPRRAQLFVFPIPQQSFRVTKTKEKGTDGRLLYSVETFRD